MRVLFLLFVILVMFAGMMSEQQASASQEPMPTPSSAKTEGMRQVSLNKPINSVNCTTPGSQVTLRNSITDNTTRTIILDMKDALAMKVNIETQADGSAIIRWSDGKLSGDNQMTLAPGQSKTISMASGCDGMRY